MCNIEGTPTTKTIPIRTPAPAPLLGDTSDLGETSGRGSPSSLLCHWERRCVDVPRRIRDQHVGECLVHGHVLDAQEAAFNDYPKIGIASLTTPSWQEHPSDQVDIYSNYDRGRTCARDASALPHTRTGAFPLPQIVSSKSRTHVSRKKLFCDMSPKAKQA